MKSAISIAFCLSIGLAVAFPQNVLDKTLDNDIASNDIVVDRNKEFAKPDVSTVKSLPAASSSSSSSIRPSETATPIEEIQSQLPTQKPPSAIARIIDDIFQIPISVLQSVSRLLTNPFIGWNKTPETAKGY